VRHLRHNRQKAAGANKVSVRHLLQEMASRRRSRAGVLSLGRECEDTDSEPSLQIQLDGLRKRERIS
jgi:hypothetical protein